MESKPVIVKERIEHYWVCPHCEREILQEAILTTEEQSIHNVPDCLQPIEGLLELVEAKGKENIIVRSAMQLASHLKLDIPVEDKVKISAALSLLVLAVNADPGSQPRLLHIAKNLGGV